MTNAMMRAGIFFTALALGFGRQPATDPPATRQAVIVDTVLQLPAFSLTIPSGWSLDGTILPGPSCVAQPAAVYRAISPDGAIGIKLLPSLTWRWAVPRMAYLKETGQDCLAFDQELTAAGFLKKMAAVLDVELVAQESTPELAALQEKIQKQNDQLAALSPGVAGRFLKKGDMARAVIRYKINSIPVEGWLTATVLCSDSAIKISELNTHFHACSGTLLRAWTRQGGLEASRELLQSISASLVPDEHWVEKFAEEKAATAARKEQADRYGEHLLSSGPRAAQEALAATLRVRQYEDFMTFAPGAASGTPQASQTPRRPGDWADYLFDLLRRPPENAVR